MTKLYRIPNRFIVTIAFESLLTRTKIREKTQRAHNVEHVNEIWKRTHFIPYTCPQAGRTGDSACVTNFWNRVNLCAPRCSRKLWKYAVEHTVSENGWNVCDNNNNGRRTRRVNDYCNNNNNNNGVLTGGDGRNGYGTRAELIRRRRRRRRQQQRPTAVVTMVHHVFLTTEYYHTTWWSTRRSRVTVEKK